MCLGIPGQIVEIVDEDIFLAKAEVSGVRRNINIGLVHHEEEQVEVGAERLTENTLVITSGFTSSRLESLFQRGIPIGRVSKVDFDELETYQRVHVKPFADFRQLDIVQVLTRRGTAAEAAFLPGGGG
jgi:hydrogenase maturation factor